MVSRMSFRKSYLLVMFLGLLLSIQAAADMPRYSVMEKAWLNEHHVLRVGVIEQNPPILSFTAASNPQGLVADYLRALTSHLGVQLEMIRYPDRESLLNALQHAEVDVVGTAVVGSDWAVPLIYTRPYLRLPVALFASGPLPADGLSGLKGKDIAVVQGGIWETVVPTLAPGLTLKPYPNLQEALQAVSSGAAFAYLGDSASVRYLLDQTSLPGIQEQQPLDLTHDIALASPAEQPALQSLLQKGLDLFGKQELREIWHRWPDVERPENFPSRISPLFIWLPLGVIWTLLVAWAAIRYNKLKLERRDVRLKQTIHRLRRRELRLRDKFQQMKIKAVNYRKDVRQQRQRLNLLDNVLPSAVWVWEVGQQQCQWDGEMFSLYGQESETFVPTLAAILDHVHEDDQIGRASCRERV